MKNLAESELEFLIKDTLYLNEFLTFNELKNNIPQYMSTEIYDTLLTLIHYNHIKFTELNKIFNCYITTQYISNRIQEMIRENKVKGHYFNIKNRCWTYIKA